MKSDSKGFKSWAHPQPDAITEDLFSSHIGKKTAFIKKLNAKPGEQRRIALAVYKK